MLKNLLLTAAPKCGVVAKCMNPLTNSIFEGGPEEDALEVLERISDESKSFTVDEALSGLKISSIRVRQALETLAEYSPKIVTLEIRPDVQHAGDRFAYRITDFGKSYLRWIQTRMEVGVFAQLHAR